MNPLRLKQRLRELEDKVNQPNVLGVVFLRQDENTGTISFSSIVNNEHIELEFTHWQEVSDYIKEHGDKDTVVIIDDIPDEEGEYDSDERT